MHYRVSPAEFYAQDIRRRGERGQARRFTQHSPPARVPVSLRTEVVLSLAMPQELCTVVFLSEPDLPP